MGEIEDADESGPGPGPGTPLGAREAGSGGPGAGGQEAGGQQAGEHPLLGPRASDGYFAHERLHVFQVAREFFLLTTPWRARKMPSELREQFYSATVSILSNIAEGASKTAKADKRRIYEIAKGSTGETAAQFEIIHLCGAISANEYQAGRQLLVRIAKMLHRLCGAPRTA